MNQPLNHPVVFRPAPPVTATALVTLADALTFQFGLHSIRVVRVEGRPWFVAKDACRALKISNHRDALLKLDKDEKDVGLTDTPGGEQEVTLISESGLYTLILRCRGATTQGTLPHRFRRWVTGEVLPEIQRRGSYGATLDVDDPQVLRRLLVSKLDEVDALRAKAEAERLGRLAAEEDAAIANEDFLQASRALTVVTTRHEVTSAELARKTDRVEALQPKALAYDAMSASRGSDCVSDVAKDLRMLPCRLFERLDEMGWIMRRGRGGAMVSDTRKGAWIGADLGLRKEYVEHANPTTPGPHGLVTRRQVMITAKGKARLEMLLAQGSLALRSSRG